MREVLYPINFNKPEKAEAKRPSSLGHGAHHECRSLKVYFFFLRVALGLGFFFGSSLAISCLPSSKTSKSLTVPSGFTVKRFFIFFKYLALYSSASFFVSN